MSTGDFTARLGGPADMDQLDRGVRRWWVIVTALIVAAVFTEAVFAGAMLSGAGWARRAHALTAVLLVVLTAAAGLVATFSLRRVPQGLRLGLTLLSLAAALVAQAVLGALIAKGASLAWLHVPLGVLLVGLAARALAGARNLG